MVPQILIVLWLGCTFVRNWIRVFFFTWKLLPSYGNDRIFSRWMGLVKTQNGRIFNGMNPGFFFTGGVTHISDCLGDSCWLSKMALITWSKNSLAFAGLCWPTLCLCTTLQTTSFLVLVSDGILYVFWFLFGIWQGKIQWLDIILK